MLILIFTIVIGVWIACGILAFGNHLATFQFKYPLLAEEEFKSDFCDSILAFFFGPISLVVEISMGSWSYGLLYHKPYMMYWRVEQLTIFDTIEKTIGTEFGRGPYKEG